MIYSSAVLVYGIGINRATVVCEKSDHLVVFFVKMLITVSSSAALVYVTVEHLLLPADLTELYPFATVLIFSAISVLIEAIIRITARTSAAEFAVSLLCIILAVNESTSIVECIFIACLCTISFYALVPILYAIKKRIEIAHPEGDFRNSSLILISLAIIMIALVAWSGSWLNPEVFQ